MVIAPLMVFAPIPIQRGRAFVSVEAHVGSAFRVAIGKVTGLEPVDYRKPEESFYPGSPYRVSFAVSEVIKGHAAKDLNLILCLQRTDILQYLRDHQTEVMLVGSQTPVDEEAELGLEPTGSHYSFRILRPLPVAVGNGVAEQLNISMNRGRMFDLNLRVLSRREEILSHARAFAKKYPATLSCGNLYVPNEFGVRCGYTNAYCMITLPLCPESKDLAMRLKKDDGWLLRDVKPDKRGFAKSSLQQSLLQFMGGPARG